MRQRRRIVLELRLHLQDDLVLRGGRCRPSPPAPGRTRRTASGRSLPWTGPGDRPRCGPPSPGRSARRSADRMRRPSTGASSASAASRIGAQWLSSAASVSVSVYWYCACSSRPPTVMSWPACMKNLTPCNWAICGFSRSITCLRAVALVERLELDEHPRGALGGVVAGRAGEADHAGHRGILQDDRRDTSFSSLPTAANDVSWRACNAPKMKPVSCSRNESLRDRHIEVAGQHDQRQRGEQHQRLVAEHPAQPAVVAAQHAS